MRKDRVLHVVRSLNYGGVESRMRTIALSSAASQFDHLFCAIADGGSVADDLSSSGAAVSILGCKAGIPSPTAIFSLARHIKSLAPKIVHCHGAEANFHGIIAGRLCGVPVCVAEEIGVPDHSLKAKLTFRLLYRLASSVVAVSQPVKRALIEIGEVSEDNCVVILNPFRMLPERAAPGRRAEFVIGYVGRLEEVKNPGGLVRAVSILRDRGVSCRLIVVGGGSQDEQLAHLVRELKLEDCVTFLGFLPRPFEALQGVDLYVLPSFSEGLSNSLVEAMSACIPALATAVGGTPDVIRHGENGWLVSGTDSESIANGIEACMTLDRERFDEVGQAGRVSVVERFSAEAYFAKCDSFYNRLLVAKIV